MKYSKKGLKMLKGKWNYRYLKAVEQEDKEKMEEAEKYLEAIEKELNKHI